MQVSTFLQLVEKNIYLFKNCLKSNMQQENNLKYFSEI